MAISEDQKLIMAGQLLGQDLLDTLLGNVDKAKTAAEQAGITSKETNAEDNKEDAEDTAEDEDSQIDAAFSKKMESYSKKMMDGMREEMKSLFMSAHEAAHTQTKKEMAALIGANNQILVQAFATAMQGMRTATEKAARDATIADLKEIAKQLGGVAASTEPVTTTTSTKETTTPVPLDDFFGFVAAGAPDVKA